LLVDREGDAEVVVRLGGLWGGSELDDAAEVRDGLSRLTGLEQGESGEAGDIDGVGLIFEGLKEGVGGVCLFVLTIETEPELGPGECVCGLGVDDLSAEDFGIRPAVGLHIVLGGIEGLGDGHGIRGG
jgi:hypothetical protein